MLKQRLLTAAILIPLVVWGVLALPNTVFAVLLAVIVIAGFWEWAGLMGIAEPLDRLCVCVAMRDHGGFFNRGRSPGEHVQAARRRKG
ncbi:MAG: phosphatidate cytidylyltransferase [Gammaproteobacteria bacterium]|nr:phosphatidate cytidylyltransferase [Gammaproteobacteria bacterium]